VQAQISINTLPNGLTVLLNPIEQEERIAIDISFRAGADAQTASTAGLFSLLEYILFNGPAANPGLPEPAEALDVLEPITLFGGTSINRFEFGLACKKQNLTLTLDTLSYLFSSERREFLFGQPDGIESARNYALDQLKAAFSNNDCISDSAINKKLFSKAPYRSMVSGTEAVIKKADATVLQALASQWLVPNNACIAVAGGFAEDEVMPLIEERFGSLPKGPNPWPSTLVPLPKPGVATADLSCFP